MGIESISQPIGQIVRLRGNFLNVPEESGWFIDGVPWTGAIRTVGIGKDFTLLADAITSANTANEDCLFLVDAGTHALSVVNDHIAYIRGLGATAADTILEGYLTSFVLMFVENIWWHNVSGYQEATIHAQGPLIINKSTVGVATGLLKYGIENGAADTIWLGYTKIIPTYAIQAYWWGARHINNSDRGTFSLQKVSWVRREGDNIWADDNCTGVYALDDYAADGTVGYGPDYGDFRITLGPGSGDILSVAQPIKDMRLRRNSTVTGTGWNIDGVLWAGAIRTVGAGKDFATFQAAVLAANAAAEDCLFIIDSGTYSIGTVAPQYDCYVRGLGATSVDTILTGSLQGGAGSKFFLENTWLYFYVSGSGSFGLAAANGVINKCTLGYDSGDCTTNPLNQNSGLLSVDYTKLIAVDWIPYIGSGTHISDMNRDQVSLNKVAWSTGAHPGWREDGCSGIWAVDDKAVDGTAGYGPGYGALRITQGLNPGEILSVSQPISTMRLRRNLNNVPG